MEFEFNVKLDYFLHNNRWWEVRNDTTKYITVSDFSDYEKVMESYSKSEIYHMNEVFVNGRDGYGWVFLLKDKFHYLFFEDIHINSRLTELYKEFVATRSFIKGSFPIDIMYNEREYIIYELTEEYFVIESNKELLFVEPHTIFYEYLIEEWNLSFIK